MGDMYKNAGVNLEEAASLNKKLCSKFNQPNFSEFVGGLEYNGIKIFSCTDGIGTKIIPLYERKLYKTIAVDLVAANLNDMATRNVKAIGFSDYIAVNKLDSDVVSKIIFELNAVLSQCNCELLGGETAEMPDLLKENCIDIAGFALGIGKTSSISINKGDIIVGLKSSGIHANGFSLIRKLYKENLLSEDEFAECLKPTFIYYNTVRKLWDKGLIKAGVNVTGGGLEENLPRIVELKRLELYRQSIPCQPIYTKLAEIVGDEMQAVFNCGVGFCIFCTQENKEVVFKICKEFEPFELGRVLE